MSVPCQPLLTHEHMHIFTHTHTYSYTHTHTYTHAHARTPYMHSTHRHTDIHTCTDTHMHTHIPNTTQCTHVHVQTHTAHSCNLNLYTFHVQVCFFAQNRHIAHALWLTRLKHLWPRWSSKPGSYLDVTCLSPTKSLNFFTWILQTFHVPVHYCGQKHTIHNSHTHTHTRTTQLNIVHTDRDTYKHTKSYV